MFLCAIAILRLCSRKKYVLFLFLLAAPSLSGSAQNPGSADARVSITQIQENCRQLNRLVISLQVCNSGNRAVPRNTPVSFYTSDPQLPGARRYANTWLTTAAVGAGRCRTFRITITVTDIRLNTFYAVVNDNGRSRSFRLPNTTLRETSYDNNIAVATAFRFRVTVMPVIDSLERGDSVLLSGNAENGIIARYNWSSGRGLSCMGCRSPLLHILKNDSSKRLIAVSRDGCRDTSFSTLYVRPQADYSVRIDSVICAGDGRGNVHFTVCDNSYTGQLPDSLPVSFYQGYPASGKRIGRPYILRSGGGQVCAADSFLLEHLFTGDIIAIVHDTLLGPQWHFPSGGHYDEDVLTNNTSVFDYAPPHLQIFPADTIVIRGSTVPLRLQSNISGIVSYEWIPGPGTKLDCDKCAAPAAVVRSTAEIQARVFTGYGCAVEAREQLRIFPPDFTGMLLESHCYKNDSLLVSFRLCMNNGYDTVRAGIPILFSGKRQRGGLSTSLAPVFFTPGVRPGGCADYQLIIAAPVDSLVAMEVNSAGNFPAPQIKLPDETNRENNQSSLLTVPYRLTIPFADTILYRGKELRLSPALSGDEPRWVQWQPALFLDCAKCLSTSTRPEYNITYRLRVSSALGCTDSAQIRIQTVAGARVNIPNAFSPNGNGLNDVFYVSGKKELVSIKHISIFNRTGQKIMERNAVPPNDPAYGWDGNYHGDKAPVGAYVYFLTVLFSDGSEQSLQGTVLLLR